MELSVAINEQFGSIRTTIFNNQPYFVATDVAKALGYTNPQKAVRTHCKGVNEMDIPSAGGEQTMKIIPEGDIYRLAIKSKLPKAAEFEKWIFDEVIPSIRKNGGYIAHQEELNEVELMARALTVAQKVIERREFSIKLLEEQIEQERPKVEFFDTVADSKTAISMNEVAKVLDMGIGRNKLFETLRELKVLQRNNVPYQRYVDNGWFRVIEQSYQKNGEPVITTKTLVYQKGVNGIRKLLTKEE